MYNEQKIDIIQFINNNQYQNIKIVLVLQEEKRQFIA